MAGPVYRAREGGSAAREVRDQRGGGCGKAPAGAGEGARGQVSGLRKTCAGAEGTGEFLKPSREGFVDPPLNCKQRDRMGPTASTAASENRAAREPRA